MVVVSVIIPARNEQFLSPTIEDLVRNSRANTEIIAVLEGYWPDKVINNPAVHYIHFSTPRGMRNAINAGVEIARGKYIMKCDAHCAFGEGYDEILKSACDDNWVVVPRRYSLDPINWERKKKSPIDYHYLSYPLLEGNDGALHGRWWRQRGKDRADIPIDLELTSQGSCWFMSRKHWDWLGGLQIEGYGDFIQEFQEVGCKTWLGGGEVKVNKKTWYAHLHKGRTYGRGYFLSKRSWHNGLKYSTDLWLNNRWEDRIHDFEWLIEKFWPVPTWPDDWREQLGQ